MAQLERKVNFIANDPQTAVQLAFPQEPEIRSVNFWKVRGVVVIEGFGGSLSPNDQLPVLPAPILQAGLLGHRSLLDFHLWAASLIWLPQEGFHFDRDSQEEDLGDFILHYDGMVLDTTRIGAYHDYVMNSLSNGQQ